MENASSQGESGKIWGPALFKRVGLNTTWLGLARLLTQAQLAALTILAARRLGGAVFGEYALVTSIVAIGNVLTTFGTDTLMIREIARDRRSQEQWAGAALALQLGLSVLVLVGVFLAGRAAPNLSGEALDGLRLYAFALVPLSFFSVYTAVLRGYQRMDLYLWANLLLVTFQTLGAWATLALFPGLVPLLAWLLVTQSVGAVIAGWMAHAAGFPGFALAGLERARLGRIVRFAWALAAISLLGIVYQRLGVLALSAAAVGAPVGWFAAGSRVVEALKLAHVAVLGALLPALSNLSAAEQSAAARKLAWRVFALLAGISALAAGLLAWKASFLVSLLLGAGYAPVAPLLQVMGWSLLPYTVSACLSVWEVAHGREGRLLKVIVLSTGISLGVYALLVQRLGVSGAAWAYLASESLQMGIFVLFEVNALVWNKALSRITRMDE